MSQGARSSFINKLRALGKRSKAKAEAVGSVASAVLAEAQSTYEDLRESELKTLRQAVVQRSRRLTVVMSHSVSVVRPTLEAVGEEVHTVGIAIFEEAQTAAHYVNETKIRPFREAVGAEWREYVAVVSEDEGLLADTVRYAYQVTGTATNRVIAGVKNGRSSRARRKSVSLTPRAVWRSLKQAKDLILDEDRSRQFEQMSGPEDSAARLQLARSEAAVDRYLKVAATSVGFSTLGMLLLPPLKLVSAGLILYAAFPVFKGAYHDLVIKRRVSIKLLDSVSFIGLIAGGYFLICSLTATIFHASTKIMLKTEDRSRQMLADMFGQQPRTVLIMVDGKELEIPFELLAVGDTLVVHAGQMIAIDGVVSAGTAAVDQHVLTGEAQPAEKGLGDRVFAATMLLAGRIEVRVEKTGKETAAAQIREVLANSTDFRSAIQARWVSVADKSVLPTLGIAALALLTRGAASGLGAINSNYVAVLKVASPLGMLNFLQRASQAGILIKDGRALEAACRVDTVVFDKTGTLTQAEPHVGEIHVFGEASIDEVLTCAAAVEANQSHPIAQAILQAARTRNLVLSELQDAKYEIGYGIEARVEGRVVRVGSARYMAMEKIALPTDFEARGEAIQAGGASLVYVAFEDHLAGAIELQPTLRPEAKGVLAELKDLGLTLYIISGDQTAPTRALAQELGIDHYFAEVLPQDKSRLVEQLQREGRKVCFVGDGINDAIALKNADVAVSLRGASSLATNTAQIILMDESLKQLAQLFEVARDYNANLKTLLTTTFLPGLVSLSGVFFLGTGTGTALVLFNLSMLAGLVNAVWPALQKWEEPEVPKALPEGLPQADPAP